MSYIMPGLIAVLLIWAAIKKVDIYEAFVSGAGEALPLLIKILPCMAAMMVGLKTLRASGALDWLIGLIAPGLNRIGFPAELVPLFVLRPFSGSAAMSLLKDVFDVYGPDGYLGVAASLMLGSTETIFYTIALYFGSISVKKTRVTVPVALLSGVVGAAVALVFARLMFASGG